MSLPNIWYLRRVAEASAKACDICYKPTSCVLTTPDQRDFFYLCHAHLGDRGFASPLIDEEANKKSAAEARQKEIEIIKKQFEEKQKKKEAKKKEKEKGTDDKKDADKDKQGDDSEADKKKALSTEKPTSAPKEEENPRIFALHKTFYQMRLDRVRNQEIARRNRARLKNPSAFPPVPSGNFDI